MIKENKVSKYLLYAVGEIVLVVIGILIALQINNANDDRKARLQEITILKNIQQDITLDTNDLNSNIQNHKKYLKNENALLSFMESELLEPLDTINYTLALSTPLIITLHKSTFNNLQNNDIGILTNNELKKNIARLYDYVNTAVSRFENDYPAYQTYSEKKPYFLKYFKLNKFTYKISNEESNNKDFFMPNLTRRSFKIVNLSDIKKDEAFKIALSESIFLRNIKLSFYIDLVKRIKELNADINTELNILSN